MSKTKHTDSDARIDTQYTQADFSVGDAVRDAEDDDPTPATVVNLPPVTCTDWEVGETTVAEMNPDYPSDTRVVVVMFDGDLDAWGGDWEPDRPLPLAEAPHDATYAFPPGRLRPVGQHPDGEDDTEATGGAPADKDDTPTLREELDAIAAAVDALNVDSVAVDTFREEVVVDKLGMSYTIDSDGTVDSDDTLAQRLEDAVAEAREGSAQ